MSDADDFDDDDKDREDEDQEEDEDEDEDDDAFSLGEDGFILSGMECLNEMNIRAVNFVRTARGSSLDVRYALTEESTDMLSASFDRFASLEAYLTLTDMDDERRTILTLKDLRMAQMELVGDIASDDEMCVNLSYDITSFTQQIFKVKKD